MYLQLPFSLVALLHAAWVHSQDVVTISAAANAAQATGISQIVDPSFAGFGIEPSNLYSFTGGAQPNQLTINLLANLAAYSGRGPHIRLGGNTQDNMFFDRTYNNYDVFENPNAQGQGAYPSDLMKIGPRFFEAIDRFPVGTPITYGLNLAYQGSDYADRIVNTASAAVSGLKRVQLVSFEIGNEPDLYNGNQFRTPPYTGNDYTREWLDRAAIVYQRVLQPAGLPRDFFEAPATASTIGNTFEITQLVQDGIMQEPRYISCWNQHDYFYFVGVTGFPLTLEYLARLSNTEGQFAYWEMQVAYALTTGLPYHLREMASAGPIGLPGISDTFGAALWTLNFFLYAARLNITSVQMHLTDNSFAAAWQPINLYGQGPHVRPSYSAYAAMAQIIGSGSGTTRIAPLTIAYSGSTDQSFIRAYASYASDSLVGIIVINSRPANASVAEKPFLNVTLSVPSSLAGQTIFISRLIGPGADSLDGTYWNGMSYETSPNGRPTPMTTAGVDPDESIPVGANGLVTVSVRDSSAIVAQIGFRVGDRGTPIPANPSSDIGHSGGEPRKKSAASPSLRRLGSTEQTLLASLVFLLSILLF